MLKQIQFFLASSKLATQMPGFRTRTPWKQLAALIGYPILFVLTYVYMSYQMNHVASARDGILLGINNFVVVLCMIILPFILITNIKDIRNKLPLFKEKNVDRKVAGTALTVFLLFAVMGVLTTSISKFYSEEFVEKISDLK